MQKTRSRQKTPNRVMVMARQSHMSQEETVKPLEGLGLGFEGRRIGRSAVLHADCFEWLKRVSENTLHAIVTDPPYGVKEYDADQLQKVRISVFEQAMASQIGYG
jgi:hypothetical protein